MLCDRNECTGCLACLDSCPYKAIYIEYDEEGFFYPGIHENLCRECGCCTRSCPILNKERVTTSGELTAYSAINLDKEALMKSSSGGVFDGLCRYVRKKSGMIAACCFDKELKAIHSIISASDDFDIFKGSKYVQSYTEGIYSKVKIELNSGTSVLFCGTPCQVAALNSFLAKTYDNLITIDFICHGVPSPNRE